MFVKKQYPPTQKVESRPAPIGGINARDNVALMPPTDAVSLINWIPDSLGIRCRKGFKEWAINFPANREVQSVFGYIGPSTVFPGGAFLTDPTAMPGRLFAATSAAIYDITSQTNAPASVQVLSGNAFAGWMSTLTFTNSAGTFLIAVSETDGYYRYNGTTWVKLTLGAGANQVANVDPANFVHVVQFGSRLWFTERNSTKAWYLATNAIEGAATAFDFGPLFKNGGHLAYMGNWTIDAGESIDDFLVVVGSNGDVLIYKGQDPSSPSTFAKVGSWFVGQIPVGRRGAVQFGGDLIITSAEGVYPVSYVTRGGAELLKASDREYTSKIKSLIGADLRASFTSRGWQIAVHPSERLMLINVPDYGSVRSTQYAMSTTQNGWSVFNDIPIYSLGSTAGYMFAGTKDGRVLLLFTGFFDGVPYGQSIGQGIRGTIIPAYDSFGTPGLDKHFLMVRPSFLSADTPNVKVSVSVNYSVTNPTGSPVYTAPTASLWDAATWGAGVWGGGQKVFSEWVGVGAVGFAGAASLVTVSVGDTILTNIDYMLAAGGPL